MRLMAVLVGILSATHVAAHEMTPTYPELEPSYVRGVLRAGLSIFNAREDVEYYAIGVFDVDWNPIPYASTYRIMKVPYAERQDFEIFIREQDRNRVVFVCTTSMLQPGQSDNAIVSSRICSRLDGARP